MMFDMAAMWRNDMQHEGERMRDNVTLPYGDGQLTFHVPEKNLLAVLSPRAVTPSVDEGAEIRRALRSPIGAPPLALTVQGACRIVVVADDMTRLTPVKVILPILLDELYAGGVRDDQVSVLIALGTHRPMTESEIAARFGSEVTRRVNVVNSPWQEPGQLVDLGTTPNGTPIQVARQLVEADYVIGVGSVVPHHIPGYSAGAKIIQPGATSAMTTGATHFLSTRTRRSYLGVVENPVRAEMEAIAERVGLKAVMNVVLDTAGRLVQAFYGDPRLAFRAGVELARQVYGVVLPAQADIVIAGSHPCDIEFWQAHKSLYPADIAVRQGGTIIVVTPCPEGVAMTHREMLNYTALDADTIQSLIENGTLCDVASGALALAWAKVRQRADVSLVSDGISEAEARALGFTPFASLDEAVEAALRKHGPQAIATVLTHAPDMLPVLPG